ncbi:Benzoylformate decarboxylase [Solidesulfovibrio carbinoliphilus subsp. oakridgensis]|uniref:Benzoylformate decarboxylase n=1 Tax=Solidesulfovibrio carbinoliphilus subsp. oakridgensis TaxID=694327 RepID=G7Q8D1_9BACT|nr:acetolactate synthase large subunit [Solidesulfovibrio carbinoliphilus]EHJ48543.1 Benzoylformate decarboxylase [Solidesulfovibrio carbinoliphilus subsp. oakridgensis]
MSEKTSQPRAGAAPASFSGPCNGAESLVATLVASGVDVCFANPGTSEMHFVSALDRIPGMRPVLCLFEGVVTGAADGYARMAGKPACTLLHLGPGFANSMANLHNARRAQSPVVNIVGDHATSHERYDAPLNANVTGFAEAISHWVCRSRSPRTVAADAARAVQAARQAPGRVATLILPADTAWLPAERPAPRLEVCPASKVSEGAVDAAAEALRSGRKTAILMRGAVLHGDGLRTAGRIAAKTGATLFCDTFTPRLRGGAGSPVVERLAYRGKDILRRLDDFGQLLLVGAAPPVSFFAYPGQESWLTPPHCEILTLSHPHEDGNEALAALAEAVGAPATGAVAPFEPPVLPPPGPLTAESVMRTVAALLPENAIVTDEGITSTLPYTALLATAAPHDYLPLTGGSIGGILPLSTGAALAAPDRKVVCLEGDGSAMYTLQALWTQARERLDVVTVIYANRSYAVLNQELRLVQAASGGERARSLLDLHNPSLDWTRLAEGMGVPAVRAETTQAFAQAFAAALGQSGPRLIEAVV